MSVRLVPVFLFMSLLPVMPAAAQSGARVGVGAAVAFFEATDEGIDDSIRVTPLVRVRRDGWAPAVAFNWFTTEVTTSSLFAARGDLAIRPVMAGVSYTVARGTLSTSLALVGGYSFNRIAAIADTRSQGIDLRVADSAAWAPIATAALDLTKRLGLVTQIGYVVARPTVTVRTVDRVDRSRWKADSLVLQIGAVVGLF